MHPVGNLHNFILPLPSKVRKEFEARFLPPRAFSAGELLYQSGEEPELFYQLITGEVNVGNYSFEGKELVLARLQAGDCIGEAGFFDDLPRATHAIAHTPILVKGMRKADFLALYREYPEISHQLLLTAYHRIRILMGWASDANLLGLSNRLIRVLQDLYYSRSRVDEDDRRCIDISHEELGAMVVASRQSVSKELKILEQKGMIEIKYGKIYVSDIEALNQIADTIVPYQSAVSTYEE